MTVSTISQTTLVEAVWRGGHPALRNVTLAILGSLALWLSAKIQVPFYPVPMTMQTFLVVTLQCHL